MPVHPWFFKTADMPDETPGKETMTMSTLKIAALAAALAGGLVSLAPAAAQAQPYGYGEYQPRQRYAPQPQYVPPHIARKQAQLARRFHEKYGYVQPRPQYGYGQGYGRPRDDGYGYGYRERRGYNDNW
jgi:hypothetical protein